MLDVAIIGAGISGISVAKHLRSHDKELRIKILEASSEPGGRAKTLSNNGSAIELGAQWVQGEKGNAIFEYASSKGLLLPESWMSDPDWRWEDRPLRHMSGLEASDADKQIFEEVEQAFDNFLDQSVLADQPDDKSLGTFLDEKFGEWAKHIEHDARMMQTAFEFKKRESISGIGSPNLYAASVYQTEDVGPECVPLPHGFSSIVAALLKDISDVDIEYDCGVKEVKIYDGHVEITLEGGSTLLARTAVVTVSLGVLKSEQIVFTPKLPQDKLEAIQRTGFGQVEKCILQFDNETWETLKQGVHCLWPPQREKFKETFLQNWEQSVFAFYPNQPRSSRSLVAWIISDGFADVSAPAKTMKLLRHCLGRSVPDPVTSLLTSWGTNPRFLGSYTYLSTGQKPNVLSALGAPFGRLFFAGEHTHPMYFGTTHGAYESGARCATEIIKMIGRQSS